jgi:RNAse (barnase) inhibitor barstar
VTGKPVLEIDGAAFDDLAGFYEEVSRKLIPGSFWGRNLDAFNDILRGGFGTPESGFTLRWLNAQRSRERLGFPETVSYLERKLHICHPQNSSYVAEDLAAARRGEGQTLFEILVEIVRTHGSGGEEAEDGVELELA